MQVTFSAASLAVLESLPPLRRVEIIGQLGDLRREQFADGKHSIARGGAIFHRVRLDDLRLYFTFTGEGIRCEYLLTGHTFEDFRFRCRLPAGQDSGVEDSPRFWQLMESDGTDRDEGRKP
jgi:hypothetical protein